MLPQSLVTEDQCYEMSHDSKIPYENAYRYSICSIFTDTNFKIFSCQHLNFDIPFFPLIGMQYKNWAKSLPISGTRNHKKKTK